METHDIEVSIVISGKMPSVSTYPNYIIKLGRSNVDFSKPDVFPYLANLLSL